MTMVAMGRMLTIGALSRRTGVSVKTLRFYSDEGLLPPSGRSESGYRLYTEEHVLRIDLIRALREAGIGLEEIGRVIRRDMSLEQALELRLVEVEAHIGGLQRIACALRLAVRSGATEENLRRITMVTQASNEERRKVVAAFYEKVAEGIPAPRRWLDDMIDASAPSLPETPLPVQLDAWVELERLVADPSFVACKRASIADFWAPKFDGGAFFDAQIVAMTAASEARGRGVAPSSREGAAIIERFTGAMVQAGHDATAFQSHIRAKYDPRGARFWELVSIVRDDESPPRRYDDWRWLGEAVLHHLSAA